MKKNYMAPEMEIHEIKSPMLLTGSTGVGTDSLGGFGGYGGVDAGGGEDPASRMLDDLLNEGLGF
jgi:hypothetical protein